MKIKLYSNNLRGRLRPPSSKSIAHRAIICSALARGTSIINNVDFSADIEATIEAMKNCGADIKIDDKSLIIKGIDGKIKVNEEIFCNESGSTLRFLIPLLLTENNKLAFTGTEKLLSRPLDVYFDIFDKMDIKYELKKNKLFLEGNLRAASFDIKGDISSQFISGLLFSLPLLKEDSVINIVGDLESKSYIDLTLSCLKTFGIEIENKEYRHFFIKGRQEYKACNFDIEGDFSQAAFFVVANNLGSEIDIERMNYETSKQGDKKIIDFIELIKKNSDIEIDGKDTPDIIPILCLYSALINKNIKIKNIKRLRIKESDRLAATVESLKKLGANIKAENDEIHITKLNNSSFKIFNGGTYSAYNDHRIAMMLGIASTCLKEDDYIIIDNADCVAKSYPRFWEDFAMLGGRYEYMG